MATEEKEEKHKSLKSGLNNSADKRGFTGKERHRYIGGAIRNMQKRGKVTIHQKPKKVTYKQNSLLRGGHKPVAKKPLAHVPPQKPVNKADKTPAIQITRSHQPLVLVAKKNGSASKSSGHDVYSVYNKSTNTLHSAGTYTKMSSAKKEATIAMDADRQRLARMKMK